MVPFSGFSYNPKVAPDTESDKQTERDRLQVRFKFLRLFLLLFFSVIQCLVLNFVHISPAKCLAPLSAFFAIFGKFLILISFWLISSFAYVFIYVLSPGTGFRNWVNICLNTDLGTNGLVKNRGSVFLSHLTGYCGSQRLFLSFFRWYSTHTRFINNDPVLRTFSEDESGHGNYCVEVHSGSDRRRHSESCTSQSRPLNSHNLGPILTIASPLSQQVDRETL